MTGEELRKTVKRLQEDRQMPVRREGFLGEVAYSPDNAVPVWTRALLDPNASLRELARYYLEKAGAFDVAAFYRQRLADNPILLAPVSGLAECGGSTDLLALRGFLTHPQPKYRHAALRGVARIAGEGAVADLVRHLNDPSPSVARAAKRLVQPFLHILRGDTLLGVIQDGDQEHARRHAIQLIVGKGKWQSIPWLIRIASLPDENLASTARQFIEAWFSLPLCNQVFTMPSQDERTELEAAISEGVNEKFQTKLRTWLQGTGVKVR
jgi:HEAT repeat protein